MWKPIPCEDRICVVSRDTGLKELAAVLGRPNDIVRASLTGEAKFGDIARSVEPGVERQIMNLRIPGVESRPLSNEALCGVLWQAASLATPTIKGVLPDSN